MHVAACGVQREAGDWWKFAKRREMKGEDQGGCSLWGLHIVCCVTSIKNGELVVVWS